MDLNSLTGSIPTFLNGNREYVQGTLMVGRVCDLLQVLPEEMIFLRSATFLQITSHTVRTSLLPYENNTQPIGHALFSIGGEQITVYFYEEEKQATRMEMPEQCQYAQTSNPGTLQGDFSFTNVFSTEDLLVALVQSIKSLHEQLPGHVTNIWFAGIKDLYVPVKEGLVPEAGTMSIQNERILIHPELPHQRSILKVTIRGANGTTYAPTVFFAFQSTERYN